MTSLLNGQPAPALAADPGLLGGLAAYEALRTYHGEVFAMRAHLLRLEASAAWMGVRWPGEATLREEILAVVEPAVEVAIVVMLTAENRMVRANPVDEARVGAPLRLASLRWDPSPALPASVKHTSRAPWLLAARRAGVDEVLLVAADGNWTETNRANLLAVRRGAVHVPPADGRALAGVTQAAFVALAREAGLGVVEGPLGPGPWDELYATSTLKELAPIVEIDGAPAPGGGPVGARLHAAFRAARGAGRDRG